MLKRVVVYVFKVFVILLTLVGWMAAGITTINFMVAVTPEQARAKNLPLPSGWTAGVWNHGSYYHWWTIQERPFLFGISIFYLFACILFFWGREFWIRRLPRNRNSN
jgi:hypothetical protein